MDYADSLRQVLIRKITKTERDLTQLKLDYCRFVFGLSHRSRVKANGQVFQVRTVDVDSMQRLDTGEFGKPSISGIPVGASDATDAELTVLGMAWELVPEGESSTDG